MGAELKINTDDLSLSGLRAPLYRHYNYEPQPQVAFIELDMKTSIVRADYVRLSGGDLMEGLESENAVRMPVPAALHIDSLKRAMSQGSSLCDVFEQMTALCIDSGEKMKL